MSNLLKKSFPFGIPYDSFNPREIPILEKIQYNGLCEISENILTESLGSFDKQKEISNKVGREVAYGLKHNWYNDISVDVSEFNNETIKKVIVHINIVDSQTVGAIENVTTDNVVIIRIGISQATILAMEENELSLHIANVVGHELMHGFIYLSRYEKQQELNTTPDYYASALEMVKQYGADNLFGGFAYALYNTYYHERQAFISQTHLYVQERLKQRPHPSNDELKSMVKDTASYQAFANNIEKLTYFKSNDGLKPRLLEILSEYNIHFTDKDLDKQIDWMIKVSEETIYKIFKNAYLEINKF